MVNRVGQQLGNYRLLRHLGHGGFADVYLGQHLYLNNHAAIKVLLTQLSDEENSQFLAEARLLASLTHPNIVRVLEFAIDTDGTAYLVMEYAPRGTLRQKYPRGTCLSLAATVSYVQQVASALQYAHNHSVVHRDVKPENFLLGPDLRVLLSDFGVSFLFKPDALALKSDEMVGTLPYMAPELFQGKPNFASDQYALAVVAYEWLCGKRPFEGNAMFVSYQHLSAAPPPLRSHDPSLSHDVEEVILKALSKDAQQRYANVQLFAQELAQASGIHSLAPEPASVPEWAPASLALPASTHSTQASASRRVILLAAPRDKKRADQLARDLRKQGIIVWEGRSQETQDGRNGDNEHTHQEPDDLIRRAVRASDAIVLIVSSDVRSISNIQQQLRIASLYQRRIVCIQIDDTSPLSLPPASERETMRMEVLDGRKEAYPQLLDELVHSLKQEKSDDETILPESEQEPRSPYKGLRAFTQQDATDFFGRDRLIDELLERIQNMLAPSQIHAGASRLLAVIGSSGSGKSSVVMGGLLPRLQQKVLPGSDKWIYLKPMVPGARPLEALARTLTPHLPPDSPILQELQGTTGYGLASLAQRIARESGQRIVLLVDQFEEVFTMSNEGQRFIDQLVTAATEVNGPLIVLLTLRADFYHRSMAYPALHRLIEQRQKTVLPMEQTELREVIRKPATLPDVQLAFEGNLVGDLLYDVQEQAGALPLLQFTLDQLFLQRKGHLLTVKAYRNMGGVKGALARHAETTYNQLPTGEHRSLTRYLFLRLIDPGQTEQDTTRRRAALSELTLPDLRQTTILRETTEAFITARLLTTDQIAGTTTIEVSHEALIREWPKLGEWLHHARDDIRLQQTISADASEWQRRGQPEDLLYRGLVLSEAETWAKRQSASIDELHFLRASSSKQKLEQEMEKQRQERELQLQKRATNRMRVLVAVLSVFLVVSVILSSLTIVSGQQAQKQALLAQQQASVAQRQARIAASRALARQAQTASLKNQQDTALLLATKAYQMNDNFDTRDALMSVLLTSPHLEAVLHAGNMDTAMTGDPLNHLSGLAFGKDNKTLITSTTQYGGQIISIDLVSKQRHFITPTPFTDSVNIIGIALSPDGRLLATLETNGIGNQVFSPQMRVSFITLYDLSSGKRLQRFKVNLDYLSASRLGQPLAFSPNGRLLAVGGCRQYPAGDRCAQAEVLFIDVFSRQESGKALIMAGSDIDSIAFSRDGARLAVGACTAYNSSPGSYDCTQGIVYEWDTVNRSQPVPPLSGHTNYVLGLAYSPDGKTLATGGAEGVIRLWDARTGQQMHAPLTGHTAAVTCLAFSPDGSLLVSGSADTTVRLWSVKDGILQNTLRGHAHTVSQVAFSPDGQQLASGSDDNTIMIWRLNNATPISRLLNAISPGNIVFSPDGKLLASGVKKTRDSNTPDFEIRIWDVATGKINRALDAPEYHDLNNLAVSFSADGKSLAAIDGRSGSIAFWDVATGKRVAQFAEEEIVDNSLIRFSPTDPNLLAFSPGGLLAFSPDGRLLAYTDTAKIWDRKTGKARLLAAPNGTNVVLWDIKANKQIRQITTQISDMAFSPDGKLLATSASASGDIVLLDISTGKATHQVPRIPHRAEQITTVAFSPDGSMLATAVDATVALWYGKTYAPLIHPTGLGFSMVFSPDSRLLATATADGIALWSLQPRTWVSAACSIASRNFTKTEWDQMATGDSYHPLCPEQPSHYSLVTTPLAQANLAATNQDNKLALSNYKQALAAALQSNDPLLSDLVCWYGALDGFAKDVMPACDHAVQLAPQNGNYHDSHAMALALAGDTWGAITEFEQFVTWAKSNSLYDQLSVRQAVSTNGKSYLEERQQWITVLKAYKGGDLKKALFGDHTQASQIQYEKYYNSFTWDGYPET